MYIDVQTKICMDKLKSKDLHITYTHCLVTNNSFIPIPSKTYIVALNKLNYTYTFLYIKIRKVNMPSTQIHYCIWRDSIDLIF